MCTNALACTALQNGTNLYLLDASGNDALCVLLGHHVFLVLQNLAGLRMNNIINRIASNQTLSQRLDAGIAFHDVLDPNKVCEA